MNAKLILHVAVCLTFLGCTPAPPDPDNVDSANVVKRLPTSTITIHARRLPDKDITSLTNLPMLQNLQFRRGFAAFPAKITDVGLACLASLNLRSLRFLDLGFCGDITDAGLVQVAKMDSLTGLSVMACSRITDAGLKRLVTMTNLTHLDLKRCPQVTDQSLNILATKTNWLTIQLGGTTRATAEGIARLQAKLPNASVENDSAWEQTNGRFLK